MFQKADIQCHGAKNREIKDKCLFKYSHEKPKNTKETQKIENSQNSVKKNKQRAQAAQIARVAQPINWPNRPVNTNTQPPNLSLHGQSQDWARQKSYIVGKKRPLRIIKT
jgi:hypothetical protein